MSRAEQIRAAVPALQAVASGLEASGVLLLAGQALSESVFGWSIKTPDGSNSNNWGMIYAPGDRGTIPVGDTSDGVPFTAGAAWWSTAEGGANQFYRLIRNNYGQAIERANAGDAWGYALALWRDGPSWLGHPSKRPSYYGGFPPGHKWSLAPRGTPIHSDADHYYRILAYARMAAAGAAEVARALGVANSVRVNAPPPPANAAASGGAAVGVPLAVAAAAAAALLLLR